MLVHAGSLRCFIRHVELHFSRDGMSLRLQLPNQTSEAFPHLTSRRVLSKRVAWQWQASRSRLIRTHGKAAGWCWC